VVLVRDAGSGRRGAHQSALRHERLKSSARSRQLHHRDEQQAVQPHYLAAEAITELEAAVDDLREIVALVEKEEGVEK